MVKDDKEFSMVNKIFGGLLLAGLWLGAGSPAQAPKPQRKEAAVVQSVHAFTVRTIDGAERSLADYKGKVLLIVNVASECGFTPQYKGLQELYEKYRDRGFMVLGFPSNDHGGQEPGSEAEIKAFCERQYAVTFDLFAKIHTKGPDIAPLYRWLTENSGYPGAISWNFNKFLVDREGRVVGRWGSMTKPNDKELLQAVEETLSR
jgi:glutathione peroxidase